MSIKLTHRTFDGRGWRKWYWYLYFEILHLLCGEIELDYCGIENFKVKKWEADVFELPAFIYKTVQENKSFEVDLTEPVGRQIIFPNGDRI